MEESVGLYFNNVAVIIQAILEVGVDLLPRGPGKAESSVHNFVPTPAVYHTCTGP